MHRIDNEKASDTLPAASAPGPKPDGFFAQRVRAVSKGTKPTHDWLNAVQEEICYTIEQSSITLNKTLQNQLLAAINDMIADGPAVSGIAHVEDDTSPKLGGTLDLDDFIITSEANGDVEFNPSGYIGKASGLAYIHTNIAHIGDLDNKIEFGSNTIAFKTGGTSRVDISASGLRIGSGSRITTVLDDDAMAADSATAATTQQAYKAYADNAFNDSGQILMSACPLHPVSSVGDDGWGLNTDSSGWPADLQTYWIAPKAGTIRNLYIVFTQTNNDPDASYSHDVVVYKNGSATSLAVSSTWTPAFRYIGTASDTTHTVSVAAGDKIHLHKAGTGFNMRGVGTVTLLFE